MAPLRHLRRTITASVAKSVQPLSPGYWRRLGARSGPVQPVLQGVNRLGEGAVWSAGEHALYWADIRLNAIFRYHPSEPGIFDRFDFGETVTALALTEEEGTLLVAFGSGLKWWKPHSGELIRAGFDLPDWPDARLNDGRADPQGRFWIGSMGVRRANAGKLFSVALQKNGEAKVSEWHSGIGTSNTVCWSPDRRFFYFADSLKNTIWRYRYNDTTGAISDPSDFLCGFRARRAGWVSYG
ncbi:hypothetical protein IZ6_06560 [Terrihabitans soli]|uniref:SMP-30/Gluconolactonase/LRE-like region domain-containing protein n=1 Tax=Terrihabitans soli TaxID=708113 RepID=A0A6S6QS95_9HYPH|nr:SMP-30/gluconolactonase/LRE family protein [Terrihabitans soli]BCJ89921.1 hypothetical protein IZ6_06560 [Terrihabitans soli]